MDEATETNAGCIAAGVREFVVENFLFGDSRAFADDQPFLESGLIDSTGILELVQYLEHTYQMKVADEELLPENMDSVASVVSYVLSKKTRR